MEWLIIKYSFIIWYTDLLSSHSFEHVKPDNLFICSKEEDYEDDEEMPPPPKLDSHQKQILWGHLKAR